MQGEKFYKIGEEELLDLLSAYYKLIALNYGGVDNWDGYGQSFEEFLTDWGMENGHAVRLFSDIARYELSNYVEAE